MKSLTVAIKIHDTDVQDIDIDTKIPDINN